LAAAAGLLSSCASPAAIVPSEASRSRLDSIAVSRVITGLMRCMIRPMHGRAREHELGEPVRRDARHPAVGLAAHAHAELAAGERRDRADPGGSLLVAERLLADAVDRASSARGPRAAG
jgi:hypothetical protein